MGDLGSRESSGAPFPAPSREWEYLVAEGALHPPTVLFPILMACQAERRAPLRQPRLVCACMASRAGGDVGQLGHVLVLRGIGMTEATVGGDLVVK